MTDELRDPTFTDDDAKFLETAGVAVVVQDEGVLVSGNDESVKGYVARIKELVGDSAQITGLDASLIANAAAVAGAAFSANAERGQFVRLSPGSIEMLKSYRVIPGIPGFNRMTVVDAAGKFRGQMQWQSVAMTPSRALGLQLLAVQIALKTAIASVEAAVDRVEASVDKVLQIAEASLVGDVVGHHEALTRIVRTLDETGSLPTTDWESVASLGPLLEVGIARLREHAKRTINKFDADLAVQDRASYLTRAVVDERLGETLQLLVIAEQSLYFWQRLRIQRVRLTEPEHLATVVGSARELLAEHVGRDGELLVHARAELASYAAVKPLEIVRWMSTGTLKRDMLSLRKDLDDFAVARNSQVAGWIEHEEPGISDALSEVGNRAKAVGSAALSVGGSAVDAGASGLGWVGRKLQRVAASRSGDDAEDLSEAEKARRVDE